MADYFVNLPIRYIAEDPSYLDVSLLTKTNPELGLDAISINGLSEDWHKRLADQLHGHGLVCSIHLPFHDLQPGSIDDMILEATRMRLKKACKIAAIYNPNHLVGHANFIPLYHNLFSKWISRAITTWKIVADTWPDHPPLYLENVREYDPGPLADLLSELNGYKIRFCFDIAHWASYGGGSQYHNLSHWLETMSPFLAHLHLHDNDGIADQHLGLGQGYIPWFELFSGLELLELRPTFTLEPHTKEDLEHSWWFMHKHYQWFTYLDIDLDQVPEGH